MIPVVASNKIKKFPQFLQPGSDSYTAADVVERLLSKPVSALTGHGLDPYLAPAPVPSELVEV